MFIPLKKKYFDQFASGEKTVEYRLHGKRWNVKNCFVGRRVILSLGYSGARIFGVIKEFKIECADNIPIMKEVYPLIDDAAEIACIAITLDPQRTQTTHSIYQ